MSRKYRATIWVSWINTDGTPGGKTQGVLLNQRGLFRTQTGDLRAVTSHSAAVSEPQAGQGLGFLVNSAVCLCCFQHIRPQACRPGPALRVCADHRAARYQPLAGERAEAEATFLGLVLLRSALILEADCALVHLVLVDTILATETSGVICRQEEALSHTATGTASTL